MVFSPRLENFSPPPIKFPVDAQDFDPKMVTLIYLTKLKYTACMAMKRSVQKYSRALKSGQTPVPISDCIFCPTVQNPNFFKPNDYQPSEIRTRSNFGALLYLLTSSTFIESFVTAGSRHSGLTSPNLSNTFIGEYKYTVNVGEEKIKIYGSNANLVRVSKLRLTDEYSKCLKTEGKFLVRA